MVYCQVRSPTGSILGPMLFNIHVLDLPHRISSSLPQYADDTVLYRPILSPEDEKALHRDLDAIWNWSSLNKLPLNATKCVVKHVTRSRHLFPSTTTRMDLVWILSLPISTLV